MKKYICIKIFVNINCLFKALYAATNVLSSRTNSSSSLTLLSSFSTWSVWRWSCNFCNCASFPCTFTLLADVCADDAFVLDDNDGSGWLGTCTLWSGSAPTSYSNSCNNASLSCSTPTIGARITSLISSAYASVYAVSLISCSMSSMLSILFKRCSSFLPTCNVYTTYRYTFAKSTVSMRDWILSNIPCTVSICDCCALSRLRQYKARRLSPLT